MKSRMTSTKKLILELLAPSTTYDEHVTFGQAPWTISDIINKANLVNGINLDKSNVRRALKSLLDSNLVAVDEGKRNIPTNLLKNGLLNVDKTVLVWERLVDSSLVNCQQQDEDDFNYVEQVVAEQRRSIRDHFQSTMGC